MQSCVNYMYTAWFYNFIIRSLSADFTILDCEVCIILYAVITFHTTLHHKCFDKISALQKPINRDLAFYQDIRNTFIQYLHWISSSLPTYC